MSVQCCCNGGAAVQCPCFSPTRQPHPCPPPPLLPLLTHPCPPLQEGHCHSSSHLHSSLLQPLMQVQQSFVLADPSLPDTPIVHASEQFLKLTGYPR